MSRAARREKRERELATLEAEFRSALVAGLRRRDWGFLAENRWLPNSARAELVETLRSIRALRLELGYAEPFALGLRFEAYGRMHRPNDPGEPKLCEAFLQELGEE